MTEKPDRAALAALIARVEGGETGRELDAEIGLALGWCQVDPRHNDFWWTPEQIAEAKRRKVAKWLTGSPKPLPAFSCSIDAQEALPGRIVQVRFDEADGTSAWTAWTPAGKQWASAPTEAGARLAARLRAMMEDDQNG